MFFIALILSSVQWLLLLSKQTIYLNVCCSKFTANDQEYSVDKKDQIRLAIFGVDFIIIVIVSFWVKKLFW